MLWHSTVGNGQDVARRYCSNERLSAHLSAQDITSIKFFSCGSILIPSRLLKLQIQLSFHDHSRKLLSPTGRHNSCSTDLIRLSFSTRPAELPNKKTPWALLSPLVETSRTPRPWKPKSRDDSVPAPQSQSFQASAEYAGERLVTRRLQKQVLFHSDIVGLPHGLALKPSRCPCPILRHALSFRISSRMGKHESRNHQQVPLGLAVSAVQAK
jgi:hypothetical protein